jgi:hypothetical protein
MAWLALFAGFILGFFAAALFRAGVIDDAETDTDR